MRFHPFNLRRRLAAQKYRKKEFQSVIRKTNSYLAQKPEDFFMLELKARAYTSLRDWQKGFETYEKVFKINPEYRDCAFQLARCAIYTKNWVSLDKSIPLIHDELQIIDIQKAMLKKSESLSSTEFVEAVNHLNLIPTHHKQILDKWANLSFQERPNQICPMDKWCLDQSIGGAYLGLVLYRVYTRSVSEARNIFERLLDVFSAYEIAIWVSPALEKYPSELQSVIEWIISEVNPLSMPLETLEALCIREVLPSSLEEIVKRYLQHIQPEKLPDAVRVIGRKTDPRKYITIEMLENMIQAGISISDSPIHTWMIEHCLRSNKVDLIHKMFEINPTGIAEPIKKSLKNLVRNRYDNRLYELLEIIFKFEFMVEEIGMRQEIAKSILSVFEPTTAFLFAYECVQIEPQDAVSGLHMLQAAIMTGSPKLILQASDIALSMKYRSGKIDYASIAIAAIRENKLDYAKNLLIENRVNSDTRSQRIRIGIPFHLENDYQSSLIEIENTQENHLNDPTIILYKVQALMELKRYKEALKCATEKVKDLTESLLLQHMIYRHSRQQDMAKSILDSLMKYQNRNVLPDSFFENNYRYQFLDSEPSRTDDTSAENTPLVTIIMTVHKWNDAFPLAVKSVLNQFHSNLELIVVDDCSTPEDVKRYDLLLTDHRIKRIRLDKNSGTYTCRNKGIELAQGEYITFADSDDWNHPDRISNSIRIILENNVDLVMGRFIRVDKQGRIQFNGSKISQFCLVGIFVRKSVMDENNLQFDGRARFSADSEFIERFTTLIGKSRILRHDGIDIIALHHEDSLTGGGPNAIDWMGPGETRVRYVSGYRRAHEKLASSGKFALEDFTEPSEKIIHPSPSSLDSKVRELLGLRQLDKKNIEKESRNERINVFMATYPGGFKSVGKAINSLLEQSRPIDRIVLHVNSDKSPPNLPKDPRIDVRLSETNYADNGKFRYMNEFKGYFLTVDDDICYPPDYVERMVSFVDHQNRRTIIGVHGAVLPFGPPVSRWSEYREHRRTHVFTSSNSSFTQVNCLGTGTIAFHSQIGIPKFEELDTLRMVDLHIAVWAQKNSIDMYSCPRDKNWLTEFEVEHETRIWAQANTETNLQAKMIQTLNKVHHWPALSQFDFELLNGPLSILQKWKHRQLPIGMKLPVVKEWTELPNNPKVTIYIPAYNTEKYIVECVKSALNQTYSNIEVSIQNGGDDDDTLALLETHFSEYDNVIISSRLSSLGEGTNIAISQGTGELILQLDSDDILHPKAAEMLVEAIGKTNVCAYGNFLRINEFGEQIDEGWEEPLYSRERLTRSMIIHHPRLFRRDAWDMVERHDEKLRNAEDYDFFLKLSEIGEFVHVRETLYSYRILEGSASNFSSDILTKNTHYVQNKMLQRNQLPYFLDIPNESNQRNIRYKHLAYSTIESNV